MTTAPTSTPRRTPSRTVLLIGAAVAWVALWFINERLWTWLLGDVIGLHLDEHLGAALHFFFYDTCKILLLLSGVIFVMGLMRASLDVDRARDWLAHRGLVPSLILAVALGVATPFCSCSSIPLFIGFVAAGIPLSITLTFLIASPLVSEVAAIMIGDHFGWHIAGAYIVAGSVLAFGIGLLLSRFRLDHWVEPFVFNTPIGQLRSDGHTPTWSERIDAATREVTDIVGRIWKWMLIGVAIGAIIHGWVPADLVARWAGPDNPVAVPLATLAGVPLYVNGAGVVPIGEALWAKGMPLGTVMSLMMASIALSIPEAIMLRKVLKWPLLGIFFGSVTVGIIVIGYLFNTIGF